MNGSLTWTARSGHGTNPVCKQPYAESVRWPGTGCEHCGHTKAEHSDRR